MDNYSMETEIVYGSVRYTSYIYLSKGYLTINKYYAWDGPSGPTWDSENFMRGSLVHDALYQLMREDKIPKTNREYCDKLLKDICLEDGMSKFRAWYVYHAVRAFGRGSVERV